MKQGKILSDFAPIDTLVDICRDRRGQVLTFSDMQLMHPFIYKAEKAAENLSRFALQHFNSDNEYNKELSRLICNRFQSILHLMDFGKFSSRSTDSVAYLNNRIRGIHNYLFNTIEACQSLADVLPPESNDEMDDVEEDTDILDDGTKIIDSNTDEDNDDEEGDDELEDDYEEEEDDDYTDDKEENNETPKIFKKNIKEDKVIEALGNLYSDKVKGKRRWYVIYRVLLFIEWLRLTNQIVFINWVKSHFAWNGVKEFRGVQSEFTHSDPPKWDTLIIKGKNGKPDNEELGPDYYDFAVAIRDTFVEVEVATGKMQDKDEFRAIPHQGVLHNSKWK